MELRRRLHHLLVSQEKVPVAYRALRHLSAGGFGTGLYLICVALLVEFGGVHPVASVVISTILLDVYTYGVSRYWVYKPSAGHLDSVPRFLVVLLVALALNTGIMHLTVNVLGLWYVWGLVAATVVVPATNFLLSYYWAFR